MHRRSVTLLLVGILALAAVPAVLSATRDASAVTAPAFVTYNGPGAMGPIEETFGAGTLPVGQPIGSEPSLGINPNTGALLYILGEEVYRVSFDDAAGTATWTEVTPPNSRFNLDPMLYTDKNTGRTYAGGLAGPCSIFSFTDDDGASWTPLGNSCSGTSDHETIVSGPWRNNVAPPGATHPRAVYYCAQQSFVVCSMSLDGGFTFIPASLTTTSTPPGMVACSFINPGLHGSLHVDSRGRVNLPFRNCGGKYGAAFSLNNGLTWGSAQVPNSATSSSGFDADIGAGPSRTYIGYQNASGQIFVASSTNGGAAWSNGTDVMAGTSLRVGTQPEVIAGDDDRVAVAFYGTADPGDPFATSFSGIWHLYVATSYDAGATWTVTQITTDPVQRGAICAGGVSCTSHRNLLDFMDATIDTRGYVHVAYTDGCVDACASATGTPAMSTSAVAGLARQVGGRPLLAAFDPILDVSAGGPYTGASAVATTITATVTGGTGPYSFAWTLVEKPAGSAASAASFGSTSAASTTFTPDIAGSYRFRVTVTDAGSLVDSDSAVLTATGVSPPTPFMDDPTGDHGFPGTDIVGGAIHSETAADFVIDLEIDGLENAPGSTASVLGIPFGADTVYTFAFNYEESPGNVVQYQVAASSYAVATPGNEFNFELQVVGAGTTNFVSPVATIQGAWDVANGRISWVVPRAELVVKAAPTGPSDDGIMTGGTPPGPGSQLTAPSAEVRTWVFALVGVGPGGAIWDTATGSGTYTFTS